MMRKNILSVIVLALVAAMALGVATPAAYAQDGGNGRTITVTGIGGVVGIPDIAIVSMGVETGNPDIITALTQNNASVDAVIAALEAQGIAREDIRTEYFNIYQERPYYDPSISSENTPAPTFRITHILTITLREVGQLGDTLNTAIGAGANVVNNVYFEVGNRSEREQTARIAALSDARIRAEQIATELGVELGDVITVVENYGYGPVNIVNAGIGSSGDGNSVFAPGSYIVGVTLTVTFAIQ